MIRDELNVWYEDRIVGYLWRNAQGYIGFKYDEDWLTSDDHFAVSLTLPLASQEYSAEENSIAHRFFANLLPEEGVRLQVVRDLKIPNTDFDLLGAIGGECAGALSILPVEKAPLAPDQYEYEWLDEDKLARLIERRGQILFHDRREKRPRLSLAGAQNKCPVLMKDGRLYLPKNEEPTTHILKFELEDYKHIPAYETFTTMLASETGLPVVDIALCSLGDKTYTCIARYDRLQGARIGRLHQEDFCQALGYGYGQKYEQYKGPGFASCYQLVREHSVNTVADTENLLLWLIFNYLAGNSDGHAKNLSFLYHDNIEPVLSPFYDLVCTRAIERVDTNLPFSVGGRTDPGHINKEQWEALAKECDIGRRFLLKQLQELAERLLDVTPLVLEKFEAQYGHYPALQRVEQVVVPQCQRTLKYLNQG